MSARKASRGINYQLVALLLAVANLQPAYSQSLEDKSADAAKAEAWQANPELVQKLTKSRREFNYVEANVPEYSLPDPLRLQDGQGVASPEAWRERRRPELMDLFRETVYGQRPQGRFECRFVELERREGVFDGKATGLSMQAIIRVEQREYQFPFVVFLPKRDAGKSPAVILINNRYFTPLDKAISEEDDFWPVKRLIDRGYATAAFHTSDVDPDRKDGYAEGVRAFFANGEAPQDNAWRSLSAWGWAASRVLDFMESVDSVDATRAAVVGHSRGGKTSLWAACEDPRFAIAYSNNSGCGGAALSRRAYGETVKRITSSFPHWFCKNFWAYAGKEDQLPVDQHEVMALIAPRGVYVASADSDLWADPRGEYAALVAAAPVFKMLNAASITESQMPALNQARVVGKTGYHIRTGGHGLLAEDWELFLDYSDQQFEN